MFPNYFMEYFFLEIYGYVYEIQGENKECRYSNECNCSYHGLVFIAWKYNEMNKSIVYTPPLPQGGGGGVEPPIKFDRTSTFRGECWERG